MTKRVVGTHRLVHCIGVVQQLLFELFDVTQHKRWQMELLTVLFLVHLHMLKEQLRGVFKNKQCHFDARVRFVSSSRCTLIDCCQSKRLRVVVKGVHGSIVLVPSASGSLAPVVLLYDFVLQQLMVLLDNGKQNVQLRLLITLRSIFILFTFFPKNCRLFVELWTASSAAFGLADTDGQKVAAYLAQIVCPRLFLHFLIVFHLHAHIGISV
mmetsp:Transcript_17688/g.24855  ORF Transcript_17688/g.24855 Transcript_17688/m.24855 type:complete len:211 (+) Transcript_17688:308-940(+)